MALPQKSYSLEAHLSALETYVGQIEPVMPNVRIRSIVQPGLARTMLGLCAVDMGQAVPLNEEQRLSSLEHLLSPGSDEDNRFDEIVGPFYAAYVGYWCGDKPAELANTLVTQANLAINGLAGRAIRTLGRAANEDRNDEKTYASFIENYAGRLAVIRHGILRSSQPTRIPVAFPDLSVHGTKRPRR